MQININAEVILSQLGYAKSEASLQKAEKVIEVTKNFHKFSKHIISLNDILKKMNAYVGLSNKTNYLKIKCDENDAKEILEEFKNEVIHWANKYNVLLKQNDNKNLYYIVGAN